MIDVETKTSQNYLLSPIKVIFIIFIVIYHFKMRSSKSLETLIKLKKLFTIFLVIRKVVAFLVVSLIK